MYMIVAVVIALLSAVAPPLKLFITFIAPWYVALFVGIFFILFIISMFGLSPEKDFPNIIKDPRVYIWIIIIAILIFITGLGITFGPSLTPGDSPSTAERVIQDPTMEVIGGQQYAQPGQLAPPPIRTSGTGSQLGQPGSTDTGNFQTNVINTIFHPKVIGMMITFLIAAVTVFFLSRPVTGS